MKFTYWSISRDKTRERTVNPYALLPEAGSWYLIGRDLDEDAERTFRVSRIVGEIRFATPEDSDNSSAFANACIAAYFTQSITLSSPIFK